MKRRKIFEYVVRDLMKHPESMILPWWGIALHWILFPIMSLRYWHDHRNGYNVMNDTWTIHGIKVSGRFFYELSRPGHKFEVVEIDDAGIVTLRELE